MTRHIVICDYEHVTSASAGETEIRVAAAELLRALGHPLRMGIVQTLADQPLCVHELVDVLRVDQPLVSQHLRVLRSARVLRTERRGKEVLYSLADRHVAHIAADAITHVQEH